MSYRYILSPLLGQFSQCRTYIYALLCSDSSHSAVRVYTLSTFRTHLSTLLLTSTPCCLWNKQSCYVAQWAGRRTEKPSATQTRVRFPGAVSDLSPSQLSVQTLLRRSPYSPVCSRMHRCYAHVNNPKHRHPYHCLDTRNTEHTGRNG